MLDDGDFVDMKCSWTLGADVKHSLRSGILSGSFAQEWTSMGALPI